MADEPAPAGTRRKPARPACPICRRPAEPRFQPFCSPRCRDQDLLNWFGGRYAVPAVEAEEEDGAEGGGPQPGGGG